MSLRAGCSWRRLPAALFGDSRRRPDRLYADRAYDHRMYRRAAPGKGIGAHIARRD